MHSRVLWISVAVWLFTVSLRSDSLHRSVPVEPLACATSEENDARLEHLHRWTRDRVRGLGVRESAALTARDGMFVLEADPLNSPFRRPLDLNGSTLRFIRQDAETFRVSRGALEYSEDLGTRVRQFVKSEAPDWFNYTYALRHFAFPFFGESLTAIHLSAFNTISPAPRRELAVQQYGSLESLAQRKPLIAPLMLGMKPSRLPYPELWINETTELVRVTWKTVGNTAFRYDVQATLFRNGDIMFSYRNVPNAIGWGSVIVTSGRESWRDILTPLSSVSDAMSDPDSRTDPSLRGMLDVVSASLSRVGSSDLLEARVELAEPIDRAKIAAGDALRYFVSLSNATSNWYAQYVLLSVSADGNDSYYVPGWGSVRQSPAARVEGKTIVFQVLQDALTLSPVHFGVVTSTARNTIAMDWASTPFTLAAAPSATQMDLSAMSDDTISNRPILEAFVLPIFNTNAVWEALKSAYALRDDEVDGVAIYQKYYTDLILYAGAYSTVGNPQVDGIGVRSSYGKQYAKRPALLHMNAIDYGWNATDEGSIAVSLHEFGHRWLYHLRIREGETNTRSLNPTSSHPAEFVHTPAAFNVRYDTDYSTMGGSLFTDNGNGTYSTPRRNSYFGYSWHELYLMGLAAPEEVPSWFYLDGTNLDKEYWPPPETTVSGTRKNVVLQQVIDALGPRSPSPAEAQRTFKVAFVLVTEPGVVPTAEEMALLDKHRRLFETSFRRATGGRADVTTRLGTAGGPRRRGARR